MMTESELFSSAFISYVFLYYNTYRRLPSLQSYNRVVCFEMPHLVYNFKIEGGINLDRIEIRDANNNILIENQGSVNQTEFVVRHQERYAEIRFYNYSNRYKIEENGHVYYAQLESSDQVKIETEQYPRVTYNFRFS